MDVEYHADRQLDKALIARLGTCGYIDESHKTSSSSGPPAAANRGSPALSAMPPAACITSYVTSPPAGAFRGTVRRQGRGDIPQSHRAVQKSQAAHSGRMAALSPQRHRGPRPARDHRKPLQKGFYYLLLPAWRGRLARKDRRTHPGRRCLRPHCPRLLHSGRQGQRFHAQAQELDR